MSAATFKEAGNKALQAGKFDEAIEAYSQAIAIDANDHVFYSNRSAAYLSKGDAESAFSDGVKCIEIKPSWPKGYSRKGAALHALRNYEEAKATYEAGLQIAPTDAGLKDGLKEVNKVLESRSNSGGGGGGGGGIFNAQMLSKLVGHPKFGPKLSDPAFVRKLQSINSNPQLMFSDPEMMEVLQAIIGKEGEGEDESFSPSPTPKSPPAPTPAPTPAPQESFLTAEEREARARKADAVAAKERGNALYKAKNFTEAIAAYDEAFGLDPTNVMFLNNKAAVYIEMGESARAIEICEEALEKGKLHRLPFQDRAKIFQRIAGAHLKSNDIAAAIAAYGKSNMEFFDKAIERKIKNLELDLKKLAVQQYINPELAQEAKERGNLAFRESRFGDAIKEYEEAIKRDPTNAPLHNNLAAAFVKVMAPNDAKRAVEKCLELDPTYVKAWAKKGDIEFLTKEYHKALDSYRRGLELEPGNQACKDGLRKTQQVVAQSSGQGVDEERTARAAADPEIQQILSDPTIRQVLTDFQQNPTHAQAAMKDVGIRTKIERLIAAGVLQVK